MSLLIYNVYYLSQINICIVHPYYILLAFTENQNRRLCITLSLKLGNRNKNSPYHHLPWYIFSRNKHELIKSQ